MKTVFNSLEEELSVAIELLSHTLEIVKEKSEIAKDSPIMQDIFARLSPDELETVKEREPEETNLMPQADDNRTQLEREVGFWLSDFNNLGKIKIGNGYFVRKDITAIRIFRDRMTADVTINNSRTITVVNCI